LICGRVDNPKSLKSTVRRQNCVLIVFEADSSIQERLHCLSLLDRPLVGVEVSHFNSTTSHVGFTLPCSIVLRQGPPLKGSFVRDQTEDGGSKDCLSCAPRVPMLQPTHAGHGDNLEITSFPSLYRPLFGCVFPQSIVSSIRVTVAKVITNQLSRVGFIEHDRVVQQFYPAAPLSVANISAHLDLIT